MSGHIHKDPVVPRAALIAAAGMILLTAGAVASVRTGLVPAAADSVALRAEAGVVPVHSRDLVFIDTADGSVVIRDVATGVTTTAVAAGSKTGFIRGVMRGLARTRHLAKIDKSLPFRLTRWSNGDLTIVDPQIGRPLELGSFGPTNRADFERLL